MAGPVHADRAVSAGTYRCTNCGYELEANSTRVLPPCHCGNDEYDTVSGDDTVNDPNSTSWAIVYPDLERRA